MSKTIGGIVSVNAIKPKPTPLNNAPSASDFLSSQFRIESFSGTSIKIISTVFTTVNKPKTAFVYPRSDTMNRGSAPIC